MGNATNNTFCTAPTNQPRSSSGMRSLRYWYILSMNSRWFPSVPLASSPASPGPSNILQWLNGLAWVSSHGPGRLRRWMRRRLARLRLRPRVAESRGGSEWEVQPVGSRVTCMEQRVRTENDIHMLGLAMEKVTNYCTYCELAYNCSEGAMSPRQNRVCR